MAETIGNTDIIKLSNELIYQRHLFNREHRKDVFMKMSIPEYIALQYYCNGGDIRHLFRTSLSEGFSGQASDDDATDF